MLLAQVLSLHLGVLIYGLAEGTLPGPSAAQSLARMVADSSIEEAERPPPSGVAGDWGPTRTWRNDPRAARDPLAPDLPNWV